MSHNEQILAKTNQLLEVETKLRKETKVHASDLEKTIESLTAENTKLKKELEEAGDKYKVCHDKMVSVQKYLDTLTDHIKDILHPLIGKHHFFSLFLLYSAFTYQPTSYFSGEQNAAIRRSYPEKLNCLNTIIWQFQFGTSEIMKRVKSNCAPPQLIYESLHQLPRSPSGWTSGRAQHAGLAQCTV